METQSFLKRYRSAFDTIQGMFSFEAALLIMAYAQLAADHYARADTLEIGVHHGLSAVAVACMRGESSWRLTCLRRCRSRTSPIQDWVTKHDSYRA
jgi:hypothetical protein